MWFSRAESHSWFLKYDKALVFKVLIIPFLPFLYFLKYATRRLAFTVCFDVVSAGSRIMGPGGPPAPRPGVQQPSSYPMEQWRVIRNCAELIFFFRADRMLLQPLTLPFFPPHSPPLSDPRKVHLVAAIAHPICSVHSDHSNRRQHVPFQNCVNAEYSHFEFRVEKPS